ATKGLASCCSPSTSRPDTPRSCWLTVRSEEHTSELQSLTNLVCRLLLEHKTLPWFCRAQPNWYAAGFSVLRRRYVLRSCRRRIPPRVPATGEPIPRIGRPFFF